MQAHVQACACMHTHTHAHTPVLSWHLPGESEKNTKKKNLNQDSWSPGQHLNLGCPEYEACILTT